MVVFESILASKALKRKPEMHILEPLGRIVPILLLVYLACKVSDIAIRGVENLAFDGSIQANLFLVEMGLGIIVPMCMLLSNPIRKNPFGLFSACALIIFGVVLNRINVFLIAYTPVYKVETYFPSLGEISVTLGLISILILAYRFITIHFPVLPAAEPHSISRETL